MVGLPNHDDGPSAFAVFRIPAVLLNMQVIGVIMPGRLLNIYRRFEGA